MGLYADIAVCAIILIAIIVGLVKGFSKQFSGGLCSLIAFLGSIVLTFVLLPYIKKMALFSSFAGTAGGWFKGDAFTVTINSLEELNAVLQESILRILSKLSERIFNTMQELSLNTLGAYMGHVVAGLIVGIVLWIILFVILIYILRGIKALLGKMSKLPVLKTFDRIFGLIWSIAVTYLFVIGIALTAIEIIIIKLIPAGQEPLIQIIEESHIFSFLHSTNIIGENIAKLFNIDLLSLTGV